MRQETLTLLAPLADSVGTRKVVERFARDKSVAVHSTQGHARGAPQPRLFRDLGIHFARLVVIDEASTSAYPASLVLESNFDTDENNAARARSRHLQALAAQRYEALSELFSGALVPLPKERGAPFVAALERCLVPHTAAYQGHVHRDLARIELEAKVRDEALYCAARLPKGTQPDKLFQAVRAHVKAQVPELDCDACAPALPDAQKRTDLLLHPNRAWWVEGIPFLLAGAACLPATLALIALLLIRERKDLPYDLQTEAESMGPELLARLAASAASEDYGAQNALTHLVPVRGGIGRKLTLRLSHLYLRQVAQNHFNFVEQLGGIPSIHFAKWQLIDGGRRLLFSSNYDGSWESYLGDFVDQAAIGLNLAWMATEGYPNTQLIKRGGAEDEETFKAWARVHQRPTDLFYAAYPTLSVADVNNNSWLRCGLHQQGPADLSAWFRRFT